MRRLIILMLVLGCSFNVQAQDVKEQQEDRQIAFTRGRIGIDYSIPDFSTKKIDGSIIGDHLADMLNYLQSNYSTGTCKGKLMSIIRKQYDSLVPPEIKNLKVIEISKTGYVITVKTKVFLSKNEEGISNLEIPFIFDKGISENWLINNLFVYLSRACQEESGL